jgi:hypothetical protein
MVGHSRQAGAHGRVEESFVYYILKTWFGADVARRVLLSNVENGLEQAVARGPDIRPRRVNHGKFDRREVRS